MSSQWEESRPEHPLRTPNGGAIAAPGRRVGRCDRDRFTARALGDCGQPLPLARSLLHRGSCCLLSSEWHTWSLSVAMPTSTITFPKRLGTTHRNEFVRNRGPRRSEAGLLGHLQWSKVGRRQTLDIVPDVGREIDALENSQWTLASRDADQSIPIRRSRRHPTLSRSRGPSERTEPKDHARLASTGES